MFVCAMGQGGKARWQLFAPCFQGCLYGEQSWKKELNLPLEQRTGKLIVWDKILEFFRLGVPFLMQSTTCIGLLCHC